MITKGIMDYSHMPRYGEKSRVVTVAIAGNEIQIARRVNGSMHYWRTYHNFSQASLARLKRALAAKYEWGQKIAADDWIITGVGWGD